MKIFADSHDNTMRVIPEDNGFISIVLENKYWKEYCGIVFNQQQWEDIKKEIDTMFSRIQETT